jgi:hypothetical protein
MIAMRPLERLISMSLNTSASQTATKMGVGTNEEAKAGGHSLKAL